MSFRVDRNTRCSNSSAARLSTAPRSAGTSSDWEPSAFETLAESIGMCRKRSFATASRLVGEGLNRIQQHIRQRKQARDWDGPSR